MSGPTPERIVSLQILRFAAAMMVALCHARYLIPQVTGSVGPRWFWDGAVVGAAGVDLFFVISGFVIAITGPFAAPRPSAKLFFWRRWRRVAPVYFVISTPFIINAWRSIGLSADRLIATFLFWPVAGPRIAYPYVGLGWTLCFEMAFYSAVALVMVGGRLSRNLAVGATLIGVLIVIRWLTDALWLHYLINPIYLEFAAGVALARKRKVLADLPLWVGAILLAAGLGVITSAAVSNIGERIGDPLSVLRGDHIWLRVALYGLPAAAIVTGAVICERKVGGRIADLLAKGGDASYIMYLTHPVAMAQLGVVWVALKGPREALAIVAAGLGAAVAVGLLVHQVVEKPILRDLKRLSIAWPPRRPVAVAPPQPPAPV